MVGKRLRFLAIPTVALVALAVGSIIMPVSGKGNPVSPSQDQAGAKFYFGRTIIDIKAADSAVPRVDGDTVVPYADLALADEFYLGAKNAHGQLVYLETWARHPEGEVGLDTMVDGRPLSEYRIDQTGPAVSSQVPRFFMLSGSQWQEVSAQETEGETRFLRLRLLPAFAGSPVEPFAEILTQRLERKTYYSYDASGTLLDITVQERSTGFQSEKVPFGK